MVRGRARPGDEALCRDACPYDVAAADAGLCGDGGGDIRIVFRNDDDDWSEVGEAGARGAKPGEPTMGLATLEGDGPTPAALGITRHALLHSLGFQHGHPRPDTDCGFRPAGAVGRLFGWPAAAAQDAIDRVDPGNLCRASLGACASLQAADAKSLMRHQLDPRLFGDRQDSPCYAEAPDTELSDLDVKTLEALYPK